MIAVNGRIVAQGSQFSLNDVEVVSATIDIEDVRAHRAKSSRSMQAASAERYHRVEVPFALTSGKFDIVREEDMFGLLSGSRSFEVKYHKPEEEIAQVLSSTLTYPGYILTVSVLVWVQPVGSGIIFAGRAHRAILCH